MIIPHRRPFVTIFVCKPWYVPSRVTSRHHWIRVSTVMTAPILNNMSSYWWNHLISPIKVTIAPLASVRDHGLLFTIWNGWFSFIDITHYIYYIITCYVLVARLAQLVEALRYKPEGREFDSRWCHWIFSLT